MLQSSRALSLIMSLCLLAFFSPKLLAQAKLSQTEAILRATQVSEVRYGLTMDLTRGDKEFQGEVVIDFNWKASSEPLRIDFNRGEIKTILLNGQSVKFAYNMIAATIKPELLKVGANKITIAFKHLYSKDGNGLYRFVDPEDKRVYLYSNFEPYDANQMFPSFDQPDLKAKFTLTVKAPKDWTVISTVRESKIEAQKNSQQWTFPETLPLSTYVFSLHAGPYKVWEDKTKFRIPLRVMARQSMARYVRADEWMNWTRYGFDFFEKTFATPYPFGKYDQIIVPDFNAGAMENVGAVTFNERYAPRGERSTQNAENNFNTILHEMAHMWFGDLVTMKWWDDLWLNESFATYAATWALASHPDHKNAWINFHGDKNWGYFADRLSNTHPIVASVSDTDVAGSNFDGITYGKGASWLKLLAFRVGEKDFTKGLDAYFKKHAYSNTTVSDLLSALEDASKLKLQEFAKPWLNTAGLNSVEVRANCSKDAKLEEIEILQTAPSDFPQLRPHSMNLALYGDPGTQDSWQAYKLIKTDYEGAKTTLKITEALACPLLIVPNATDDDFVKIVWPSEQLERIQGDLARIADPLQRVLFWESLGWALEDGEIHLENVVRFVDTQWPLEKDYAVLGAIGDFLRFRVLGAMRSIPDRDLRMKYAKPLADTFQKILIDTKTSKDFRLLAFDFYIPFLGLSEDRETLAQIYQKKIVWPEFTLDQPRRWLVLAELAALRDSRTAAWAKAEKAKDSSDEGALQMRGIEASLAPLETKTKMISDMLKPSNKLSKAQVRATLGGMFPSQQAVDRSAFRAEYLRAVGTVAKHREDYIRTSYILSLLPAACDETDDEIFTTLFKLELPAFINQDVIERRDTLKYCRNIRRMAAAPTEAQRVK